MELYDVLKVLHIWFVIAWLGTGIALQLLTLRLPAAGNAQRQWFADVLHWLGGRWFPAVSGVVLLTGIGLVLDGPWEFSDAWITIAFVGWLLSGINGGALLGSAVNKWREGGAQKDEHLARFLLFSRIDLVILTLIVVDMVVKPGA